MRQRKAPADPLADLARMHARVQRAHRRAAATWYRRAVREGWKRKQEDAERFANHAWYYFRVLLGACVILAMVAIESCKTKLGIR